MAYSLSEPSQPSQLSFNSGFPTNLFSKSTSCVIVTGSELSDTLIFVKPYETQNPCIYLLCHNLLHFKVGTQTIDNKNWTTYVHQLQFDYHFLRAISSFKPVTIFHSFRVKIKNRFFELASLSMRWYPRYFQTFTSEILLITCVSILLCCFSLPQ